MDHHFGFILRKDRGHPLLGGVLVLLNQFAKIIEMIK